MVAIQIAAQLCLVGEPLSEMSGRSRGDSCAEQKYEQPRQTADDFFVTVQLEDDEQREAPDVGCLSRFYRRI